MGSLLNTIGILSFLGGLVISPRAVVAADVYKCVEGAGKVMYTDRPCGPGRTGTTSRSQPEGPISVDRPALATSAGQNRGPRASSRDSASKANLQGPVQNAPVAQDEQETDARRMNIRPYHDQNSHSRGALGSSLDPLRDCQLAKRDLEIELSSIARDANRVAGRQSAMRAACGLAEPNHLVIDNRTEFNVHPLPAEHSRCEQQGGLYNWACIVQRTYR